MKQEALSYFPHTELTTVAMLIFLAAFLGVVAFVFISKNKPHFDQMAKLPLSQENRNEQ